jgi:hypothetical protein
VRCWTFSCIVLLGQLVTAMRTKIVRREVGIKLACGVSVCAMRDAVYLGSN